MSDPISSKPAEEIRDMWQSRLLAAARGNAQAVAVIIMAQEWPTALKTLLMVTLGSDDLKRPFLCGYAHVWKNGAIICMTMFDDGLRAMKVYDSKDQMVREFRLLADQLKFSDKDRKEMFSLLERWIVRDHRVGFNGVEVEV